MTEQHENRNMSNSTTIKVWDLPVRIFHWSLVVLFFTSYVSGDELETLHVWTGYGVAALVVFRIFWGLVGSQYARFSNFIYSPAEIIGYLKSMLTKTPKHYLGHNPAGGVMVLLLLVGLVVTCWSGLEAYAVEGHGPLANAQVTVISSAYADDDGDEHENRGEGEGDEFWEEIHEFAANFTLFLVFVHIAGVVVASRLHGENLVRAMFTGNKQND